MAKKPKTMVTKISETKKATIIYLTNEVALHLAHRLIREAEIDAGVRIVVLNKDTRPDVQAYPYAVDRMRPPRKRNRRIKSS